MIFVIHTSPVWTSLMMKSCTVRNSNAPKPITSQIIPMLRTKSALVS